MLNKTHRAPPRYKIPEFFSSLLESTADSTTQTSVCRVLPESLSKTNWEDSKVSFDDPDRESFTLTDKFLRKIPMNELA
jgi:hypothetical protein